MPKTRKPAEPKNSEGVDSTVEFPVRVSGVVSVRRVGEAFESLLSNLPGVVYRAVNDESRSMSLLAGRCAELTGYGPEALLDDREIAYDDLIHPDDRALRHLAIDGVVPTKRAFQAIYRIQTEDGAVKWVLDQGFGVFEESGRLSAVEGYISDITEQHKLERELIRAASADNIAQLASGIAHDLNNILTTILAMGSFICEALPKEHPAHRDASDIVDASRRATNLTRQVLAFSRGQVSQPRVVDVDAALGELRRLLRRMIGSHVQLEEDFRAPGCRVRVDPAQLEQVVINLVVNARDAMPDGGKVTLRTRRDDERVVVSVQDAGGGIPADLYERIFEPFFTTKERGKGTGLGLATVRSIVAGFRGRIELSTEVGRGTRFEISLPLVEVAAERVPHESQAPRGGFTEATILVLDDDDEVRRSMARALRRAGYSVVLAGRPIDALGALQRRIDDFDLLVTDVVMPAMSGPEVARVARRIHPGLHVLFVSGYSSPESKAHRLPEKAALLQKPFAPTDLVCRVREVLGEGS